MIKKLSILLIFIVGVSLSMAKNNYKGGNDSGNYFPQSAIIDSLDTVVIDMSQAAFLFNSIRIPVSVLSDDAIYALDINFKYNQLNLLYDSISNLTNYIQAFSFYNTVDSTVRFTSNSMHVYTNDTPLVSISFTMFGANISIADLYSVNGYLNGDPCVVKLINPLGMSITESLIEDDNGINIYPNPSNGILHIEAMENSEIRILDLRGCDVIPPFKYSKADNGIYTGGFLEGIYIIKVTGIGYSSTRRILIEK